MAASGQRRVASASNDSDPRAATTSSTQPPRRIERLQRLPGGRAVVGALLVALAALGVFAAHLAAVEGPTTRYLVAAHDLAPGTRLDTVDDVRAAFGATTAELGSTVAARAVPADELAGLAGTVLLAPLVRGDLLTRTHVTGATAGRDAHTVSFSVGPAAAVGGALQPGEAVDVVATSGSGPDARTDFVVRGAPLFAITSGDGGALASGGELTLTVGVPTSDDVLTLAHAVHTGQILVSRAAEGHDGSASAAAVSRSAAAQRTGGADGA